MSYNIMADSLSYHNMAMAKPYENKYLDWEYRLPIILKEVEHYNPDIICFQEIDKEEKSI